MKYENQPQIDNKRPFQNLSKSKRRYYVQNGNDKYRWLKEPGTGGSDQLKDAFPYPHLARKFWDNEFADKLIIWPVEYIKELRLSYTAQELTEVLKTTEKRAYSLTYNDLKK